METGAGNKDEKAGRGKIVTSKEEIKYLLLLFQNLYKNEKIALEGIRQMVDLMEVA